MSASFGTSGNAAFDPRFIAELRSRVSLVSLVGRDATLERHGRLHVACCPFHGEKTPSFTVYPDNHFHCFGCQAHGDAIGYIRQRDGLDFRTAVAALAAEAGLSVPDGAALDPARQRATEARRAQRQSDARRREEREQARKHAWAARTAAQASFIRPGGTGEHIVARMYLAVDRAVPYNAPYPDSIRYHLDRNALIAIATDRSGQITGGQFIHLNRDGHRLTKAEAVAHGFEAPKETFGTISGSTVHLPARDKPWMYGLIPIQFIAESVEAGATLWQITGQETAVVLGVGNLRHAFRRDCANVVCLDDDARGSAAWKQANKAIRMARAAGYAVLTVNTWEVRRGDNSDLNDILRQSGPEGPALVRERLSTALYPEAPRRKRLKAADGIKHVRAAAAAFMQTATRIASGEDQPLSDVQVALRGDTGISKSTIMRELLADAIRTIRKAGNDRPALIFVPRIDLAEQQADLLRDIAPDLDVKVWRGRSQPGMCGDIDSIGAARARMLDPQKHVCDGCAIFAADGCNYQMQREETADIWLVAHQLLYARPPRPLAKPCLIWIDETPIDSALVGVTADDDDDDARTLPLGTLRRHDPIADEPVAADRLHELRGLALATLEIMPPGALTATPFRRAGLTAAMCQEAQKLEWSTKIEPNRDAPIDRADLNLDLGARARFWLSLATLLDDARGIASGWLRIATDREGRSILLMRGRHPVNAAWRVPTVLTDATLEIGLVGHLWPGMRLVADIAVEARHQHIRQVIDRSYGLSSIDANDPAIADNPKADAKIRRKLTAERGRRRRALRDIHAILHREARLAAPGRLLAVAQKRIVEQIGAIGPLPRNLDFMHHGAVSGDDSFRNASRIVVIGRQAPAPAAVAACAEALTGAACTRLPTGQWYQRIDAVHELADGRLVTAERDHHPDAIAEAFRRRITVLELQQIIGRGRGIWRTAANPLHVLVLTDVPLDLPVEELITDAAVRPSFEDRQIAAVSGIASQCAAHAAKAHPELWVNADRAQYARRVCGSRQPAGTVAWRYQVAGQGEKPALTFAPSHTPAEVVRAFWTSRLGPLAIFERAEAQPKGALNYQSEETVTGNSRYFGADGLSEQPLPFMWRAWKAWRVEHPPDG